MQWICPYVGTLTAKSGLFFLILKIIFWFFVTKHVPNVRSADVTVTVASSKSLLRAAQPLCASVGWAEVVSAAISVPLTEKHAGGGICPSRAQLNQSWLWLHDFTLKSASSINSRDLQTFSSIERLRRQYKLSPFSSCSFSLFFLFLCQPWREICKEAATTSQRCMWKLKRWMKMHLRWFWAGRSRLRPAEIPHAEEEEGNRLQRSWLTQSCKLPRQLLLYYCVSAHLRWFMAIRPRLFASFFVLFF